MQNKNIDNRERFALVETQKPYKERSTEKESTQSKLIKLINNEMEKISSDSPVANCCYAILDILAKCDSKDYNRTTYPQAIQEAVEKIGKDKKYCDITKEILVERLIEMVPNN